MKTSESIIEISKALVKAQSQMGNAKKDNENPFFKSKYADLNSVREACLPLLNENGISALQPIVSIEGKNYVETILLHESGEFISSLTEIIYSKQNDAQSQGSGITYARRYGLQSLVNIGADDDDGNKASQPVKQEQKQPTKSEGKYNLTPTTSKWNDAVKKFADQKTEEAIKELLKVTHEKFELTPENEAILLERAQELRKTREEIANHQFDN